MTSSGRPDRNPVGGGKTALRIPTKALVLPEAIVEAEGNEHAMTDRIVGIIVALVLAWIAFVAWLIERS